MGDEFYQVDQRMGSICNINDKNVYDLFNADLKSIEPITGKITTDFSKAIGVSGLHINSYNIDTGGIKLTFYVGGAYKEDCYINTSNLIAECQTCSIKTDEDSFEYIAVLTSFDVKETGIDFYNEVVLTFSAIRRLPMERKVFDGCNGVFKNRGSVESGAVITITPKSSMESITVNRITVKNLSANLPFIIDGLIGEVKCSGVNRFLDTDLVDFPKVQSGENTVEVSSTNAKVEISFYPTFIV